MGLLVSGKNPAALKTAERSYFTATAGQTTFTVPSGYAPGDIDVFINGVRIIESDDYFASNGSTVVLTSAANAGDSIVVVCYYQFQATGHWTKSESDARYLTAAATTPLTGFLRSPNYGISSTADNLATELTAAPVGQQGVGVKAYGRSMSTFGGDLHHIADIRGAGGSQRFYGWNGTSLTNYMNIDSSGRITASNQPLVTLRQGSTISGALSTQKMTGFTSILNVGGAWNNTTQRFTCPVSGTYQFVVQGIKYPQNGPNHIDLYVNGSIRSEYRARAEETATYCQFSLTYYVSLNAGDYTEWYTFGDGGIHADHGTYSIRLIQ